MLYEIEEYFLIFIIYSFIGWILEVTCGAIEHKKFINRGFLIGPYCPIYGVGALLITFLFTRYENEPLVIFIMTIAICSILEYITSYIMEKLFKTRWWDYSHMKFNINGRVCLETLIPFGILGLIIIYLTNPFITETLNMLSELSMHIISIGIFIVFLVDNIISFKIISGFRSVASKINKDSTEEITKKVKEILANRSKLTRRLINAFPNFKKIIKRK